MSLEEACAVVLRGWAKPSTLRAAIAKGDLSAMKIGNRYVVTPADIRAWMELCKVQPKSPAPPRR